MRYAVMRATVQQVKNAGGIDMKTTRNIGVLFATLNDKGVTHLKSLGFTVIRVKEVKGAVMPPRPVAAVPTYSPDDLVVAAGLEELRGITEPPLYGSGFSMAIIDSGIRESHERINSRVIYSKNYTASPMEDGFNHGTGVCSIVTSAAPLCNILNLKVLDNEGKGTEEEVSLAIDDCITMLNEGLSYAPCVVNLSLGSEDDGNPSNPMRVACRKAIEKGIWIIAAAGNEGKPRTIMCPGCERYVGCVGSCKYEPFTISEFSSRGPTAEGLVKPDCVFFGEDVVVASSESDTATIAKSGTSFSTPFGSSIALLFHEGYQRQAMPTIPITGIYPELGIWVPIEMGIDRFLPGLCVKPEGVVKEKDCDYGWGLPFGPIVSRYFTLMQAMDISQVTTFAVTIAGLSMVGMMATTMARALR